MTEKHTKKNKYLRKPRLRPAHTIALGFLAVIVLGAFLLCLPISTNDFKWMNFIDALFTSTSAVSTTGLITIGDTAAYFSVFGQIVLLILIQFGGVGVMSITTLFMMLLRRKITLKDRMVMQMEFNQDEGRGMVRLGRNIMLVTLAIEGAGFLLLLAPFCLANGAYGIWQALFISVSSFCNAGFDIMGMTQGLGSSLSGFAGDVMVNLSVSFLIITGGLGFTVLMDIGKHKWRFKKLTLHSKLVLIASGVLILVGWAFFFGAEFNNSGTIGNMSVGHKLLVSLFQSISPRSAGFATVNQGNLTSASKFMTVVLMFIGASPGSTGGGVRTTTLMVIILISVAGLRETDDITVGKHKLNRQSTRKAVSVFVLSLLIVLISAVILLFSEKSSGATFEDILFECASAFATSGLTCGITGSLSVIGKIVIMINMFLGRVGMITIGLMFVSKKGGDNNIRYPEGNVAIG